MSEAASPRPVAPGASREDWRVLAVVLVGTFMAILDAFIVNVALPTIQHTIGAGSADLELILASYTLLYAVFLITGGRLGDILGRKRMFLAGMLTFTLASALCGLAPSPQFLIASRAAQGFGAAMMFPQILSIIQVTFRGQARTVALGLFAAVIGVAAVLGQLIGGLLIQLNVDGLTWRPIFLVNVPVGLAGAVAGLLVLRESKAEPPPRLDVLGVGLISITLASFVIPLIEGPSLGWPVWILGLLLLSVPLLFLFVVHERRRLTEGKYPLINVQLFSQRSFSVGLPLTILFFSTLSGVFFLLAVFLQNGLGFTPFAAGLTFTAVGVGFITSSLATPRLVPRFGRHLLSFGYALDVVGYLLAIAVLREYGTSITVPELAVPLFVIGFGNGFGLSPLIGIVLAGARTEDAGQASGMLSTATQIGNTVGVALYGLLFFGLLGPTPSLALPGRYVASLESVLALFALVSALVFGLVLGLPRPGHGRAKDLLLVGHRRRPLAGLAYSFFFLSGGRVGRQLFDEMLGEATRHRAEGIRDSAESFPDNVVQQFLGVHHEDERWIQYLTKEALESGGHFEALQDEREAVLLSFVQDLRDRQARGQVTRDVDPEYLALLLLAASFYPRIFAAATRTVTGLKPTDPEFERQWSQFLRGLAKRFEAASDRRDPLHTD
ncbi:MAG: MFS transporter [Thermoplasmata archaeon]|nr:MFS transporter [Thermoplasmata archaeon]